METPFRETEIDPNASPIPGFTVYSPNLQQYQNIEVSVTKKKNAQSISVPRPAK